MILKEYNAIFFHVPKTAGYSIEQYFLGTMPDWRLFNEEILYGLHESVMTQHLTYNDMQKYRTKDFLDAHFKFAFFRNTWERFCSAFFYLEDHYLKKHGSFENFVCEVCNEVNTYKHNRGWHFAKQTDWLFNLDKNVCLNYVGRFEDINNDFKIICDRLSVPFTPLKKLNASKRSATTYRDVYTDKTKSLIAEAYAEEIEYFDFKF